MKKLLFVCIFLFIILFSLFYPSNAISASKNAMLIWGQQILPTLLPFSILSAVLLKSNLLSTTSKHQNLFAICIVMICGFTFGFPIGSKLAADFYEKEMLTRKQAHILAITANNFSSMYVCGFVLPLLFPNGNLQKFTYVLLYLFPLVIGTFLLLILSKKQLFFTKNITFSLKKQAVPSTHKNTASRFQLDMQIIDAAIVSSFETLIKLCGYIVMFSLLSTMLQTLFPSPHIITELLIANMEITNGITLFSNYEIKANLKYICTIQLLSLGGLSGFAQTASILQYSNLSVKKYVFGKCILSFFATVFAILIVIS